MLLNPYRFGVPSIDTDPYFSNVSLLLHGDGANNSTTIIDTSNSPKTVSAIADAKISTTLTKFGGSSIYLDGTGDYLDVSSSADLTFGTGDFTIEGWFWLDSTVASYHTLFYQRRSNVATGVGMSCGANGTVTVLIGNGSTWPVYASTGTGAVPMDSWHHIAMTRTATTVRVFIDGQLGIIDNNAGGLNVTGSQITIGADLGIPGGSPPYYPLKGYVDEFRITKGVSRYTTTFTPPTAAFANYSVYLDSSIDYYYPYVLLLLHGDAADNSTTFTDSSISPKTVSANGNAIISTTQSKFGGSSMYFDGTGDFLSTPNIDSFNFSDSNFTVEFWVYPTSNTIGGIVGNRDNLTTGYGWSIVRQADGSVYIQSYSLNVTTAAGTVPINTWTHVAVSCFSNSAKIFLNGALYAIGNIGIHATSSPVDFVVGKAHHSVPQYFTGYIDEVRVTSAAARYAAGFSVPTTAFPNEAPPNVDASYPRVSILLHADGVNNSTTILDNSSVPKTVTVLGNAKISTTKSKFGGSSLLFDGTGDSLSVPSNAAFQFGASTPFTMEFWVNFSGYPTSNAGAYSSCIIGKDSESLGREFVVNASGTASSFTGIDFLAFSTNAPVYVLTQALFAFALNTWYHIAVSGDASTVRIFINGTQFGTSARGVFQTTTSPLTIGAAEYNATYRYYLNGYVDDVRITKGVDRYTSNFYIPALAFPDFVYVDSSVDPYYSFVSVLLHADGTHGSTSITDSSVSPNMFTVAAQAHISTARSMFGGSSMFFDGTGDYVVTATNSCVDFGAADWTIEMFAYCNNGTSDIEMYACAEGATTFNFLRRKSDGTIRFYHRNSGSVVITDLTTTATMPTDTWMHVAVTRRSGLVNIYLNGLVATVSGTNLTTAYETPLYPVYIGSGYSIGNYWAGYIDEVRITKGLARYISSFSLPAIAFPNFAGGEPIISTSLLLHGDGINGSTTFTDSSLTPKTVSAFNSAQISTAQSKFGGASMLFNGTSSYATVPLNAAFGIGSGDFTVELWMYKTAAGTVASAMIGVWGASNYNWELVSNVGQGTIFFQVSSNGTSTFFSCATTGSITYNTWHHVAAVKSGSSIKVYLDGVGGPAATVTGGSVAISGSQPLNIGRNASSTWYYPGYLDEIRVIKGVARYTADFTPPATPFTS